jgi:hypothetical protein
MKAKGAFYMHSSIWQSRVKVIPFFERKHLLFKVHFSKRTYPVPVNSDTVLPFNSQRPAMSTFFCGSVPFI